MNKLCILILILNTLCINAQITNTPLAGKPLDNFPWFTYIDNFQTDDAIYLAIDPNRFPSLVNQTINVFIVESRTPDSFVANPSLVDVRGDSQEINIESTGFQENIFLLDQSTLLEYQSGASLGVIYDLILDVDNDDMLSSGDLIDGWHTQKAGFYKVHNTADPGPLVPIVENYTDADPWLNKRIYYPENIESLGELPLVIVSHGWTYDYFMYDYIGEHLASYGYIVVIHANDVGNGGAAATHSASLTTLDNTDHFIGQQSVLLNGIFESHIDASKIAFLGHSTGGEGIVRAYSRIWNNEYEPENFELEDIKLLCPIAPTAWLTKDDVNPNFANFHLFSGGADADCSLLSTAESGWQQSFSIFERSKGNRQLTYIHGAGHTDLNGCETGCNEWVDTSAPGLIGKENTHKVLRSYLLPLVELYLKENAAGQECFTRMFDNFHPIGVPEFVQLAKEFKQKEDTHKLIIDDFQTNQGLNESSSGTLVSFDLDSIHEIEMRDNDGSFNWTGNQESNGFSRSKQGDDPQCVIMDWNDGENGFYSLDIPISTETIEFEFLSFRACQGTRHPNTDLLNSGLSFQITLKDATENTASISTANYGLINQPYQRGGGWANEFETVMIRLSDFAIDNPDFNLNELATLSFEFGNDFNSETGRLAIDDIELVGEIETYPVPFTTDLDVTLDEPKVLVYPNPVSKDLIIQGLSIDDEIFVCNYQGELIEIIPNTNTEFRYPIGKLSSGVYFIHIVSPQSHQIRQIIKL